MADVMAAKAEAVSRFLSSETAGLFSALSASSAPRHNVTGVGVGPKYVGNEPTGETVVRLYVERKLPVHVIPGESMLPKEIQGVATDVIESGMFVAQTMPVAVSGPMTGKFRPIQPGGSCGFQFPPPNSGTVMAGTLGAIVKDGTGKRFILSNNHVLADENQLPAGATIFQPGLLDGGNPANDRVAKLTRFVPISSTSSNFVDCAIAELLQGIADSPVVLPQVGHLSSPNPVAAVIGQAVEKAGRTTGYTQGAVFDVSATVKVQYSFGVATFADQVLVRATTGSFSAAGDSGSLIVDRVQKQGTALLFAGSATFTIGNKLDRVLSMLGVTLVV